MDVLFLINNKLLNICIKVIVLSLFSVSILHASGDNKKYLKKEKTINFKITVIDSSEHTPLEFVNIFLKKGNEIVTTNVTDHFGIASFKDISAGNYLLAADYIGYKNYSGLISINTSNTSFKILLKQNAIDLNEIVVKSTRQGHVSNFLDLRTGNKTFETETFHAPPSARMTTVIQENLTGAVRAPTGEVHIRGQHGEFSYLIDDIPIPLGVFGSLNEVVDPRVIKSITFFPGGMPAEYGLSSAIIDIQNRVPPGGFKLSISGYAGSYLTLNSQDLGKNVGTFKGLNSDGQSLSLSNHIGNFGYFLSGSREETDRRIDQPVQRLFNDHGFDYFTYGKFDYLLSESDYLTVNLNYSETQTQIPFDPAEGINFDTQNSYNSFQTISYYHTISNQTDRSSDIFAGFYVREGGLKYNTSSFDQTFQFIGNDTATGYTVDQNRSFITYGSRIKFSDELSHHFSYVTGFNISLTNGNEDFKLKDHSGNGPVDITNFTGSDLSLFAEANIHPLEWNRIEAGIRYDQHIAPVIQLQKQFSPRLKFSIFPDDFNTIYLSYDRLFIPANIEGLSTIASTLGDSASSTLPEKDNLYEVGLIHNFLFGITAKLDYFHKDSSPGLDDETLGSSTIRVNVNITKVKVSGIELSITYGNPESPFSGYLNAAIIHAYGIGPVSGGFLPADLSTSPFDLDHDQRLSVVGGLNYQLQDWFLNLVAIYGSGLSNGRSSNAFNTGLFDFNQAEHTTPSWILNLSGGYSFSLIGAHKIEPSIYVTNLLDHAHLLKGAFFSGASFEERRNVTFNLKYEL